MFETLGASGCVSEVDMGSMRPFTLKGNSSIRRERANRKIVTVSLRDLLAKCAMVLAFMSTLTTSKAASVTDAAHQIPLFQVKDSLLETKLLKWPGNYSVLKGVFAQDEDDYVPEKHDNLHESFGLLDTSANRWRNLIRRINSLNHNEEDNTVYKLVTLARHGEGYHNVAEAYYGTDAWNAYWSHLYGNGTITWGPDPALTERGRSQAREVNKAWKRELKSNVPLPLAFYSSPLQRATDTLQVTWSDIQPDRGRTPLIMEDLRESVGTHTCDQRSAKSKIISRYPSWRFQDGFTEEDELYRPPKEETDEEHDDRSRRALNYIFSTESAAFVSITAHGGTITSLFRVLGHHLFECPPGGIVPILVKAVGHGQEAL